MQANRCNGTDLLQVAEGIRGLRVDQAKRLDELEKENGGLHKAVADLTLVKLIWAEAARGIL